MEERGNFDNRLLLTTSVCIVFSVVLSRLSIGSLLYNLPLLLLVPRIKKTGHAVLSFVITMFLIVALTLFEYRKYIQPENYGIILFALVFQIASSVSAIVWTALRNYSNSVLRKLVICSFPLAIIGLSFALLMSQPVATEWTIGLREGISQILNTEALGIDSKAFADMVMMVMVLVTVPVCMIFGSVPILVSELILKKLDNEWQNEFAYMKMPNYYIWIFMAAWFVVILSSFVAVPMVVTVVGWNIALGLSLHYFMGGLSILMYKLRQKNEVLTANRLCISVFILCIFPGINILVLSGLTIVGALETWIKMR